MVRKLRRGLVGLAAAVLAGCAGAAGGDKVSHTSAADAGYAVNALTNGGAGPWRLVVITGTPSRPAIWRRFLEEAPPDLEVFVLERAGYDPKGARRPVLDFDEQVAAVTPLLDRAAAPCLALMGMSYGGQLALKTTIDNPDAVDALILGAPLITEPRWLQRRLVNVGGWWGVRHLLPYWLRNPREEVVGRRSQIEAVLERVDEIVAPTVIVHGDRDPVVPLSDSKLLQARFDPEAPADLHVAQGVGHYFFRTSPRMLVGVVERAIDKAEAGGACSRPSDDRIQQD